LDGNGPGDRSMNEDIINENIINEDKYVIMYVTLFDLEIEAKQVTASTWKEAIIKSKLLEGFDFKEEDWESLETIKDWVYNSDSILEVLKIK
jgi:hypothetical protein